MVDIYAVLSASIAYVLAFVPCLPQQRGRPVSPVLSPQEGELDSLLPTAGDGWDDAELDDILGNTPRISPAARWTPQTASNAPALPARLARTPIIPASSRQLDGAAKSQMTGGGMRAGEEARNDGEADAKDLDPLSVDRLAREWDGGLTADAMRREEEELARREEEGKQNVGREDGRHVITADEMDDEFGGFHQGSNPVDST